MKKLFAVVVFTLASHVGFAQDATSPVTNNQEDNTIYDVSGIEVRPEFPGGVELFYKYIGKNYNVPSVKGLKGKIYVSFIVERDGSITEIEVLRDLGFGTGEEAVRVLKECPKWSPGEQNGKKVRVKYALPISIQSQ